MQFNKDILKQNKKVLLLTLFIIIVFLIISIINKPKEFIYEEVDLPINGTSNINKLIINEYMTSNKGSYIDIDGNLYDWIELYNGTNNDINLKNYGLSDDENKIKWVFPEVVIKSKDYLIIYLCGESKEGIYAPFKLSSTGGETIALKNPNGKVIDIIKTLSLDKNQSAFRNLDGVWSITSKATPGYINTEDGYNSYYEMLTTDNSVIKINEILAKNDGNFRVDNKYYGYVELLNTGEETIILNNYYLSDEIDELYKYKISNVELKPNEVVVIYMSNNNSESSNLYSDFSLEKKEGSVILSNSFGKIVDRVDYTNLPNGIALSLQNDIYIETSVLSPGYPNTVDGEDDFAKKYLNKNKTLIINEIMNDNNSYLAQNGYNFYDWIELYNNSDKEINLSDYTLTTTLNNTSMYQLPDVTLRPDEYYIIMASGDIKLSNKSYNHANFKISDVESLYLCKNKEVVDSMMISNIPLNYSYGRGEKYGFYYIEKPTPGKENKIGVLNISYAPIFSIESGIYNNIEKLTISLSGNGDIYYTIDGNRPNKYSKKYTGPININKTTVIKAISYENGKVKSDIVTNSYIVNENHTMPVTSLTINDSDYNYLVRNRWEEYEVEGYIEFYEEDGSFSIPCSVALFGGSARGLDKLSFGIRFFDKYGAGTLNYPLFENRDTSVYESLVLRSSSQDYERTLIKDVLGTALLDEYTDLDVQAYKFSILYINGKYYGIYNIREKINPDFIANHYNVDPDNVNMIKGNSDVQSGNIRFYNQIINYVKNNDMSLKVHYDYIKTKMDMESYFDFWTTQLYTTNYDIINIRFFNHIDIENGKMKMILYDLDYAFSIKRYKYNYYNFITDPNGMGGFHVDTTLMRNLLKNKEFKKEFLERISYNMKYTWNKQNILNKYYELYNEIYPELERNQKRWGLTVSTWKDWMNQLETYINKRQAYFYNHTKSFFNLNNEEFEYYFGGDI